MNSAEFEELSGRIEALARSVMLLAAVLETAGNLDGDRYDDALRTSADRADMEPPEKLIAVQRTLRELVRQMAYARTRR